MRPRNVLFAALCLVAAVVCVRLGVWQLRRLQERRLRNEFVRARLNFPLVALGDLPADTSLVRFRRVEARGVYDYAHEVVLTGRGREGSPGVNIVTPLRLAGRDTVLLVNRGWVYSPDAATVELGRWRERDTVTVRGFVDVIAAPGAAGAVTARSPRAFRRLDRVAITGAVGAPVAPVVLVAQGDTAGTGADRVPVRLQPPPLDEGPHWSYAVQWFAFAAISVGGLAAFVTSERRKAALVP